MKNVKFRGIPRQKDEFCGISAAQIPRQKPKFRGSAQNFACRGKLWALLMLDQVILQIIIILLSRDITGTHLFYVINYKFNICVNFLSLLDYDWCFICYKHGYLF